MADVEFVYVAAPYTQGDVARNVKRAIDCGDWLLNHGYTPFIPHLTHFWHMQHEHLYPEWLAYDIRWMEKCDAVLRLDGPSDGADREVRRAQAFGIPVYFGEVEFIQAWPNRSAS